MWGWVHHALPPGEAHLSLIILLDIPEAVEELVK
jgi:hypothetical protein